MKIRFAMLCGAVLLSGAAPANAADDVLLQAMARCAAVSADAARLACYDGLAPRVQAAVAPQAQPMTATAAAAAPHAAAPTADEQKSWFGYDMGDLLGTSPKTQTTPAQFGADTKPVPEPVKTAAAAPQAPQEIDSITAGVTDYALNPFGKFIVTLDNGQIWKQSPADEGRPSFLRDPAANKVKIERGMIGSYILTINDGNRVFKVTRVK